MRSSNNFKWKMEWNNLFLQNHVNRLNNRNIYIIIIISKTRLHWGRIQLWKSVISFAEICFIQTTWKPVASKINTLTLNINVCTSCDPGCIIYCISNKLVACTFSFIYTKTTQQLHKTSFWRDLKAQLQKHSFLSQNLKG